MLIKVVLFSMILVSTTCHAGGKRDKKDVFYTDISLIDLLNVEVEPEKYLNKPTGAKQGHHSKPSPTDKDRIMPREPLHGFPVLSCLLSGLDLTWAFSYSAAPLLQVKAKTESQGR